MTVLCFPFISLTDTLQVAIQNTLDNLGNYFVDEHDHVKFDHDDERHILTRRGRGFQSHERPPVFASERIAKLLARAENADSFCLEHLEQANPISHGTVSEAGAMLKKKGLNGSCAAVNHQRFDVVLAELVDCAVDSRPHSIGCLFFFFCLRPKPVDFPSFFF